MPLETLLPDALARLGPAAMSDGERKHFAAARIFVEHRMGLRMHRMCAKPWELKKASRAVR